MKECLSIATRTLKGRSIRLCELRFVDIAGIYDCIRDPRFSYPAVTGTPDPVQQPLRPLRRAVYYALVCKSGNAFGSLLFGQRKHWIMSVLDGADGSFLGVVMVVEVVRDGGRDLERRLDESFLKYPERRFAAKTGDGELGFFLHPRARGQGIALQACYVLMDRLSHEKEAKGKPIVRRVWAETGANNSPAQGLLRKMGFIVQPEFTVIPSKSFRYERDGTPIELLHFGEPESDEQEAPDAPVRARLRDMAERTIVYPHWDCGG